MALLSLFSFIVIFLTGYFLTKHISIKIPILHNIFFIFSLGIIIFTAVNYYSCLIFSFPLGVYIAHIILLAVVISYIIYIKPDFLSSLKELSTRFFEDKYILFLLCFLGAILVVLFHTHVLQNINGDLYVGESTFGDLPFHLSIISQIAYGQNFPPENPFYKDLPLVYPYLINFFSAILVFEGLSLRDSIIIPGMLLSLSLVVLVYDLAFTILKNKLQSFLTTIFYFFNGGFGFYFFLRDNHFDLALISQSLLHPQNMKEYSHLFEQNIQWVNLLSRMIVPERSLLFGIPAGIIILRLLFFRDTEKEISKFDLVIIAILLSLMPLMHTHTVIAFIIILPVLALFTLKPHHLKKQLTSYLIILALTVYLVLPHIPLFLNHLGGSGQFFKLHLWWMTQDLEAPDWFWFKNSYLFIPISLLVLILPQLKNGSVRLLQVCALLLFLLVNLILFSPYNWDNVKLFFWIGLFFAIAAGYLLGVLLAKKNLLIKLAIVLVIVSMISSAALSIYREINVSYLLFSKESIQVAEYIKQITPKNSTFLTYKIHNSPVNNLAGRKIVMGYEGLLWVHGINYSQRSEQVNQIYAGSLNSSELLKKNGVNFVVVESSNPDNLFVNREFFKQFPAIIISPNYTIYQIR